MTSSRYTNDMDLKDPFLSDLVKGEAKQITPNGTVCVSGGKLMRVDDGSSYTYHNDLDMRQGPGFGRADMLLPEQGGREFRASNLPKKTHGNRSGV